MDIEPIQHPIKRAYNAIIGSPLFWIIGPFLILAQISSCAGIFHNGSPDYHPIEADWSYDQCLRDLRAPIFDRNPDMLELPDDLELSVRQSCSEHAMQHVRP